jgi:hypothetical protein
MQFDYKAMQPYNFVVMMNTNEILIQMKNKHIKNIVSKTKRRKNY